MTEDAAARAWSNEVEGPRPGGGQGSQTAQARGKRVSRAVAAAAFKFRGTHCWLATIEAPPGRRYAPDSTRKEDEC